MAIEYNTLSLEEAQNMIAAALAYVQQNGLPAMAVVVADKAGQVIASARMNGVHRRYYDAAHRKAYSAAIFERDTLGIIDFWGGQEKQGHRGPHDWNDRMVTTLPGGFVVCNGRRGGNQSMWDVIGGVGVAGDDIAEHEDAVADVAVSSLGEAFFHRKGWG
jgi:uncharacterized protein GlcG (DUF336 family)